MVPNFDEVVDLSGSTMQPVSRTPDLSSYTLVALYPAKPPTPTTTLNPINSTGIIALHDAELA